MRASRFASMSVSSSAVLLLAGCSAAEVNLVERVPADLTLEVDSPTYGAFLGDEPAAVTGRVYPPQARLTVEDQVVEVAGDGSFAVELPVDGEYRNIDVVAAIDGQERSVRLPVFSGHDPLETWPGAATGRLLPAGLAGLGDQVASLIDASGWDAGIEAALPSYSSDWVDIVPIGLDHAPTEVALSPDEEGVRAAISLVDLSLSYELIMDWAGVDEVFSVGFASVSVDALLTPWLDEDGVAWLSLSDASVDMGEAQFDFGALDGQVVEWIADLLNDYVVEPLADIVLQQVTDAYGTLELGGPLSFETEFAGTPVSVELADLVGDLDGVGAAATMGLGEAAAAETVGVPMPTEADDPTGEADLAVAVHEGLFMALGDEIADGYLSQDIALSGSMGEVLGAGIRALPGGDQVPEDTEGWCLAIDPGTARVARLHEDVADLAAIDLPDAWVTVGVQRGGACEDWLVARLALELHLTVEEGTAIGFDLQVPDGLLVDYGAEVDDPQAVVDGLAAYLETMLGLLGGSLSIDLGDLLSGSGMGGAFGEVSPAVVGSRAMVDEDGEPIEGLYALSLTLWDD